MCRWAIVAPLVFILGLPAADQDKGADKKQDQSKPGKLAKGRPLVDVEAFLREYDRNKDGFLTKDEMPEWLHYNFARLDANKDGKISKDELEKGMSYLHERRRPSDVVLVLVEMSDCDECHAEELQRAYELLRKLDKNQDGKISADELKNGRGEIIESRVKGIFERLDTNKDGKISRAEARGLVKDHFDQLDKNKDGFVDREELMAAASARPDEGRPKDKDKAKDK